MGNQGTRTVSPLVDEWLHTDPRQVLPGLSLLAHDGDSQAQLLLGQLLINGVGTSRDPDRAFHWFKTAAEARLPMAINMVGRCHEYGLGTPVDLEEAARWYHRAATFDCDWAIYNYAHLLASGRGVPRDRAAAFVWFRLAASRGHARAMHFLGQYYEHGWETPVDRSTAFAWYKRSAEGGDFRGQCSHASVLAEEGHVSEAVHWLRLAMKTATPEYLRELRRTLLKSDHAELRELAQEIIIASAGTSAAAGGAFAFR
jgi:TPR repeat protein